jgi:hypothetical protein
MDVERIIDDIEQLQEMFEGMTKCSRIAHGFGFGNGMESVAEPSLRCFD